MGSKAKGSGATHNFDPLDLNRWQKIQDLFSKIIRANLSFFDTHGSSLTTPSHAAPFCSEFAEQLQSSAASQVNCIIRAYHQSAQGKDMYTCIHGLSFHMVRCKNGNVMVIGPLLIGKRESDEIYQQICLELGCDADTFLDRVREIQVFSNAGISMVQAFLKEVMDYFFELNSEFSEFHSLMPELFTKSKEAGRFFEGVYVNELLNALLNVALSLVEGDSGSVMLYEAKEKCFYLKAARGIRTDLVPRGRVPFESGVAGVIAARRIPTLISKVVGDKTLAGRLNRAEIESSMVIPMVIKNRLFGVLCVNTFTDNKKFNSGFLALLNQLGQLGSVTLATASVNKEFQN